jgi:hypothetical protein
VRSYTGGFGPGFFGPTGAGIGDGEGVGGGEAVGDADGVGVGPGVPVGGGVRDGEGEGAGVAAAGVGEGDDDGVRVTGRASDPARPPFLAPASEEGRLGAT